MAFADNLPLSESVGVFLGVVGIDWLSDGHAEPFKAVLVAVAVGAAILAARYWLRQRKN
jgi:uncharacterized membrane-anchored protein